MTKKIVFFSLLLASTITLAQEKILLRLNYTKGDSYTMYIKTAQVMGMGAMTNNMEMTMQYIINNASTDDGFEVEAKCKKIVVNISQGGRQVVYDSSKSDKELNKELDEAVKMIKSNMEPMLKTKISLKGNNLGEITEVKMEPKNSGAEQFANQANNIVYPEKAVAVGDTWTRNININGVTMDFIYKIKSIEDKTVALEISGEVSGIGEGTISGASQVDRKSGALIESKIDMNIKMQGQELTSKTTVSMIKS
ncbi:MAG: DUF6263 family protein [Tenacibaculum sp.]